MSYGYWRYWIRHPRLAWKFHHKLGWTWDKKGRLYHR